jgi:hypothetical protein
MLVRQSPVTFEHRKLAQLVQLEMFYNTLTPRGKQVFSERTWAFDRLPNDPKFIKCTFTPGEGWDLTVKEVSQFVSLLDGKIVDIHYQPTNENDLDPCDYRWVRFE